MQIIKKITKRFILFMINLLIFFISLIIPKSEKIAIVGGWFGNRFADNSKHFYLYLNDNLNKLGFDKVVWITRSKAIKDELTKQGYQACTVWSIYSIWYHLRAKYHLIDQSPIDINAFFSVRSKRINLWHGFPLKKIGTYTGVGQFHPKTRFEKFINKITMKGFWSDYYILATSEFSAEILGKAFGVESNKVMISGYPRNYESIVQNPIKYMPKYEKKYIYKIDKYIDRGYKIIGYFPTFRDKKETLIFGSNDIKELNHFFDFCEQSKIKIVGKFHFAGKNDKFGEIGVHDSFINLPSEADIYTFLNQIDILITDYSSIYFDFLLWNRPIIFFPYDLEYYRDEDRGLIFNYDEFTPGPKAYNIRDLQVLLLQGTDIVKKRYEDEYGVEADELKKKVFGDYVKMDLEHLITQFKKS